MRYSVCVDMVFGRDMEAFLAGMDAVKAAGYPAVEFWAWWDKDLAAVEDRAEALGLKVAAFCTPFISLGVPELRGKYLDGLGQTLEAAKRLGCPTLITQSGYLEPGMEPGAFRDSLVRGLSEAAQLLQGTGRTLVVEPLSFPGCALRRSRDAFAVLEEVGRPEVKLLYDVYHQQVAEGNIIKTIVEHFRDIGHFHVAGVPGRNEITWGEIDYGEVLGTIGELGYGGFVGLEYRPMMEPAESLAEVRKILWGTERSVES